MVSEHNEQVALFQWAALSLGRYPELDLLHAIPNGGHRHKAVAAKMKAEGVKAGIPDVCLPVPRYPHHGMYVEMKYGLNTSTVSQQHRQRQLEEQGYFVVECWSCESAVEMIEAYLDGEAWPDA